MYYVLLRVSGNGLKSQYKYMTTIEAGGAEAKVSFATKGMAQNYIQELIESGSYRIDDLVVVKGCVLTVSMTVDDETY